MQQIALGPISIQAGVPTTLTQLAPLAAGGSSATTGTYVGSVLTPPAAGRLDFDSTTGTFTYTPPASVTAPFTTTVVVVLGSNVRHRADHPSSPARPARSRA